MPGVGQSDLLEAGRKGYFCGDHGMLSKALESAESDLKFNSHQDPIVFLGCTHYSFRADLFVKPLLNWDFQGSLCWIPYRHPRCPWHKIIFSEGTEESGSSLFLPIGFRTWSKKPLQPCWNKSVQSRRRLSGVDG